MSLFTKVGSTSCTVFLFFPSLHVFYSSLSPCCTFLSKNIRPHLGPFDVLFCTNELCYLPLAMRERKLSALFLSCMSGICSLSFYSLFPVYLSLIVKGLFSFCANCSFSLQRSQDCFLHFAKMCVHHPVKINLTLSFSALHTFF